MSNFIPEKRQLREVLLHYFFLKKNAAESHRLLQEAYEEHAPSISTCKYWFRRFKSGDFDVENKERPSRPKRFADEELGALRDEDVWQRFSSSNASNSSFSKQEELANSLGVWLPFVPVDAERPHWKTLHTSVEGIKHWFGTFLAVFLGRNPYIFRKMGKSSGFRWTILWIAHNLIIFHNKVSISLKKTLKLICAPNNIIHIFEI